MFFSGVLMECGGVRVNFGINSFVVFSFS